MAEIKLILEKYKKYLNKYTFVILLFFIWMIFFDRNSYLENRRISSDIHKLERERLYYQHEIEENNRKIKELLSNSEQLEKFAREQYLMKRPNEDIFIVIE